MRKHGPWTILNSKQVYGDPWIKVVLDEVLRPDSQPGTYTTVTLKSGVCVIALDGRNCVHLTKEFHYAVGRSTIEGVSGGIEEGESPEIAAQRELSEELGLQAAKWTRFFQVDPFTAAIHSTVDLFLAEELTQGKSDLEGTELIEHVTIELSEAVAMVTRGEITHAPTCVALLTIALNQLR
jgi:ADP-ribose pyrophosphatase